jgi:hypothetical protein
MTFERKRRARGRDRGIDRRRTRHLVEGGGAVFSIGSISWTGSLSSNAYDNNVSRITGNVLRRFLSREPLPW